MNAVIYYSNTGESRNIAKYLADELGYDLYDLSLLTKYSFTTAVLVFPVYCQDAPKAIKRFLSALKADCIAPVAVYGKMSYGNVLNDVQRKYRHTVIAAAYAPTKHAYVDEPRFADFSKLEPFIDKVRGAEKRPAEVKIPRSRKNPFARLAPKLRSQIGCKIVKNADLCDNCGLCEQNCLQGATHNGKTNGKCIRCARCVVNCPRKALTLKLRLPLKRYLQKTKKNDLIIYV